LHSRKWVEVGFQQNEESFRDISHGSFGAGKIMLELN
jgi:hypothetical protein